MKRQEIEQKLRQLKIEGLERIKSAPVIAFGVGILIGVFLASFQRIVIPLVVIALLVIGALWLFSEDSSKGSSD